LKALTVRVDDDFHKKIKIKTAIEGITIQNYIINLIKEDLKKEKSK